MVKRQRTAEAILRDLVKAQDALLTCYRLVSVNGGLAADRIFKLREELRAFDQAALSIKP